MKKQLGNVGLAGLVLVNVVLYLLFPPPDNGAPLYTNQLIAEIFSSSAMILMSCGIALANRPRFLEPFFGGLDRMYQSHKGAALTAIVFLFCHFFLIPLRDEPLSPGRVLGKTALMGLSALILLTLAPRIPVLSGYVRLAYHHWKITHKFVGLFFIIGFFHMLNVKNLSKDAPAPNLYWNVIVYIGMAAYVYKELLAPFFGRAYPYVVEAARQLNPSTLEVTLKPKGARPPQVAGQFTFVSFRGDPALAEQHPFTVSSSPKEPNLRLSIKASGDWTKHLYANLKAGTEARIDGCYGQLNYKTGGQRQIWIAGGIGVTPFLSWARDFDSQSDFEIDFFYTVRAEADAVFWDEFTAAAQKHKWFRATLNVSSKEGSLTVEKMAATLTGHLAERHIYMCGPLPMTEAFRKQFGQRGVPAGNIHFEEFNFR
jgi:predicted ferric reductase